MSKYPIFVLDGPDGSGKTTLANKLVEWTGAKYMHLTYRFKPLMFHYHTAAIELCTRYAEHQPVVLDRWWPSEIIYADVFRGGSKWPMGGRLLDRVALKHGVTYVFCVPSDEEGYFARFAKLRDSGREMYDSMNGVYQGYAALYKKMSPRFDAVHYDLDTHGQNLDDYCQWLIDHAEAVRWSIPAIWMDRDNRLVAGQGHRPSILFVGDESNQKTRRKVWPFFEHANSSLWLTKALDDCDIPEEKLGWINSHADGEPQIQALKTAIACSGPDHVVALGHRAAGVLAKTRTAANIILLNHPQWYRRFSHNDISHIAKLKELT